MYRLRIRTLWPAAAAAALVACSEDPTASAPPFAVAPMPDLELELPALDALRPATEERRRGAASGDPPGPARITEDWEEELSRPIQQIFDPRTRTRIEGAYGYALGLHEYIGNIGRIATTVQASMGSQYLGAFTAESQDYTPFFFDFGRVKTAWAQARVSLAETCGLEVHGSSVHQAWWQMYQGRSAPMWGVATRTSQADETSQGGCADAATGTRKEGRSEPGGVICYYKITYELDTGIIVDAQLLSCVGSGDEQW